MTAKMETPSIQLWFVMHGSEVGAGDNEGAERRGGGRWVAVGGGPLLEETP